MLAGTPSLQNISMTNCVPVIALYPAFQAFVRLQEEIKVLLFLLEARTAGYKAILA